MNWFRVYAEARSDKKLESLSDAEHRVWFHLLCFAAEQEERGTIRLEDFELLALEVASSDTALLTATLTRLVKLRILAWDQDTDTLSFLHWAERQYDKPSDQPARVTERVRKHREAPHETVKREETPCNLEFPVVALADLSRHETVKREETPCNARKRDETPHKQSISRAEDIYKQSSSSSSIAARAREETPPPAAAASENQNAPAAASENQNAPAACPDYQAVLSAQGYTDAEIQAARSRVENRPNRRPISDMAAYLKRIIDGEIRSRAAPPLPRKRAPPPLSPEEEAAAEARSETARKAVIAKVRAEVFHALPIEEEAAP